jgi:hypothetical protein
MNGIDKPMANSIKLTHMRLEIDYEPEDEQVVMTLDDSIVLKATLGDKNTLVLNNNFVNLEDENPEVYKTLRSIVLSLLELKDA